MNCHRATAIEYLMNIDGIVLSTRDPERGEYRSRRQTFHSAADTSCRFCGARLTGRKGPLLLTFLLTDRANVLA